MQPLKGKVAVVAGATRGTGRGIARMLGEAGATVYCTGRSVRGTLASGPNRPETIEETAEMVAAHGGVGIPVQVDHTVPAQVEKLFERVRAEANRLDILVNDIWGGDALTDFGTPFWKLSLENGFQMLEGAVHTHIITSRYGVPLMLDTALDTNSGLIVEVTDGASYSYRGNLFYDLVKTTVIRLAFAMGTELRHKKIAAVALSPGFIRSEAMLDHFGATEENWREVAVPKDPYFAASETPCFTGRAVAKLAADPNVFKKSGRVYGSWELAEEYGFTDIDGTTPNMLQVFDTLFKEKYGKAFAFKTLDDTFYEYLTHNPALDVMYPDWP
jgi:NAD(P)-dependent dehydrogenase (short-subunit alcohol dehydrogenase family)